MGATIPCLDSIVIEHRPGGADLLQRGHHRQHDLHGVLGGHAEDRAELGHEQLLARERAAQAAHAEERVGLGRHGQRRQRLVRPGIERADDKGTAVEGAGDLAERLGLLLLVGQLSAVQEQELGAQQTDALGPQLDRARGLLHRAEVREHLDARAVARDARLVRPLARNRAPSRRPLAALGGVPEHVGRRVDLRGSVVTIEEQDRAFGDAERTASPRPTTAGRPSARARIAAWAVAVPAPTLHRQQLRHGAGQIRRHHHQPAGTHPRGQQRLVRVAESCVGDAHCR